MLSKEDVLSHAERLGIDVDGMSWNEMNHVISEALKNEKATEPDQSNRIAELERELAEQKARVRSYREHYEGWDDGEAPTREELHSLDLEICPEIEAGNRPKNPKYIFEEELNQEPIVEEENYVVNGMPQNMEPGRDYTGTFVNRGYRNNRVTATTGGPRSNAGHIWPPESKFIIVHKGNRKGYRWWQVKLLLKEIDGGRFLDEEYENIYGDGRSKKGKLDMLDNINIIDIPYTNNLMRRIEKECGEELANATK